MLKTMKVLQILSVTIILQPHTVSLVILSSSNQLCGVR
jgi:hypothetical protein